MEEWKNIIWTKGKYSVSNLGRVKSNITEKILKGSWTGKNKKRDRTPYKCHGLSVDGKRIFNLTHRIVAEAFIDNPLKLNQINHKNKNVQDNRVENLEWVNNKQNARHAHKCDILQIKDGKVISKWSGLYEIGDAGYNKGSVCDAINKNRKAYGYIWQRQ